MIQVGACGFSYKDWRGVFYPEGLAEREMLSYYSTQFPVVELDYTYYQMPATRTIEGLSSKTPAGFTFCVKAHRSMTHERPESDDDAAALFKTFLSALAPLADDGKLGCVLCQFPWGFKRTPENASYIERLPELLPGVPVIVEFRNVEWVSPATFDLLSRNGLGFCCVDEPSLKGLFPPLAVYTSSIGYVRFHGRNARSWWEHKEAWERYNYLYTENELRDWIPKIDSISQATERTYVLFNNCHAGQAALNAKQMESLLDLL